MKMAAVTTMNLPHDCIYEILRRVGPIAAAPCTIVCKQWKRVIFRARLPIVVFYGRHSRHDGKHTDLFTAFVRNKRGYTRCDLIVSSISKTGRCYDITRGRSPFISMVPATSGWFSNTLTAHYGDYRVSDDAAAKIRAAWPDYAELAAVLGAVGAY